MFQRIIAALLLVGYFAGQLAMVPHAHAAWDAEHENAAHFHSGWLSSWFESHGHSHGCGAHSHQKRAVPENSETSSQPHPHNHDCVLLPPSLVAAPAGDDATASAEHYHVEAIFSRCIDVTPPTVRVTCPPGPFAESVSSRPLYLILRTLRI